MTNSIDATLWLKQLDAPESRNAAADQIVQAYLGKLLALIRANLASPLQPRVDPDDILQSVWKSFFSRPFDVHDSDSLQALLIRMCLNKTRSAARTHTASRRSVVHEQHVERVSLESARTTRAMAATGRANDVNFDRTDRSDQTDLQRLSPDHLASRPTLELMAAGATPEQAAVAVELVATLSEDLQQILCWRLEGLTESEIAERMNCTRRTVTRRLGMIRDHFRSLDDSAFRQ